MKQIPSNIRIYLSMLLFLYQFSVYSYSPFTNYAPTIEVRDVIIDDPYVWAASSGGLMRIKPSDGSVQLQCGTNNYPDLRCNALSLDTKGNLWVGTEKGYLYKVSRKGRHSIYTSYVTNDSENMWTINDLYSYGKYLILGSKRGCSVYDTDEDVVLQNATMFGQFSSSNVNCITVFKDTLYLGCDDGVAKLNIADNGIEKNNFAVNTIWTTESTDKGIKSIVAYHDSIQYRNTVSGIWNDSVYHTITITDNYQNNENFVYLDTAVWRQFSSRVLAIVEGENGECWFGTEEHFVYRWDGEKLRQYKKTGLTCRDINRVYVTEDGTMWSTPEVTSKVKDKKRIYPWWLGVYRFKDDRWSSYKGSTKGFGKLGDGPAFFGIAEGPYGNMWFGNNGGSLKKYNTRKNRWDGYEIGVYHYSNFEYKEKSKGMVWGKCDAITRDSSDFMWFTVYDNDSGSIICYNPEIEIPNDSDYQFFFPKGVRIFLSGSQTIKC